MNVDALRRRLRDAPFDFLSACSSSTLQIFDKEWHSLCQDVDEASRLLLLNDEDLSLLHATISLIASWSDLLLKIDDEAMERTASFMDDMEDVFARLRISDIDRAAQHPPTHSQRSRSTSLVAPMHIPAAYSWISQNIHNPYPSSEVKARISQDAGRPLRVITDWFKDVRRYIGWVDICKKQFEGSRALAVQAAKQAYLQTTSAPHLSSAILSQFRAIRTRLRDIYPAADDNGHLSDSTDDSFVPFSSSSRSSLSDQSAYARSRSSSSTPSLIFSSDDEDSHSLVSFSSDEASASLGKRKSPTQEDGYRPLKRNRSGFISVTHGLVNEVVSASLAASVLSSDVAPASLSQSTPSRKRRLSDATTNWEDATPIPRSSLSQCVSPSLRISKRRLSVSDSQPTPKRPCLPPAVGPRKQAVSTPVPIAHQTTSGSDDWFPFELPDTALSVELFNWDVVVENDALYNSLFDVIPQSDSPGFSNGTPLSDAYHSPTSLDLGASSAIDPSVLDISAAFTEPPPTQLTTLISTHSPEPITALTMPEFDFDAFLSAVNAKPQSTQSSSSPYGELSLNDSIDLFGDF